MFVLDVDRETRDLLRRLPPAKKKTVKNALQQIATAPDLGKPLHEELKGLYSYRVGRLRIIYVIDRSARRVHVVAIGPRSTIYEIVATRRR